MSTKLANFYLFIPKIVLVITILDLSQSLPNNRPTKLPTNQQTTRLLVLLRVKKKTKKTKKITKKILSLYFCNFWNIVFWKMFPFYTVSEYRGGGGKRRETQT